MSRVAEIASDNIIKILILNGAYRVSSVATVTVLRTEIEATEVQVVRILPDGRGRPIVAIAAHIVDIRVVTLARCRQEDRTGGLHLRPLGKSVAVTCPVIISR